MSNTTAYTLLLVGDRGSGKTTYIKRLLTGKYVDVTTHTIQQNYPLYVWTNNGALSFDVEEIECNQLKPHHLLYNCALIFQDCNVPDATQKYRDALAAIPIKVVCMNKVDGPILHTNIIHEDNYCYISAKAGADCFLPILLVANSIYGKPTTITTP